MSIISKHILLMIAAVFGILSPVFASSMNVEMVAAGPYDGSDYVLPYQIEINGVLTNAYCYDSFDWVNLGDQWQADELTWTQAAQIGAFSGAAYNSGTNPETGAPESALLNYEEVAWLSDQPTATLQEQSNVQRAMWDVFNPGAFTITPGMQGYFRGFAYVTTHGGFVPGYFEKFRFIEGTSGTPGDGNFPQAFVINTASTDPVLNPEPESLVFLAIGLAATGLFAVRSSGHLKFP